ncbi:hypothetical protein O6H91_23G029500 [Diphasiastrum complanatum]|uniref:Uncharacterized protein n=1 Tax=Diphasiastrum complanatum TaxID=34168 RepID=A0ACC2AB92_DIPCM|nr:hypothetical protein O6H91_23G029500 [Diphasiastrum complanatum]
MGSISIARTLSSCFNEPFNIEHNMLHLIAFIVRIHKRRIRSCNSLFSFCFSLNCFQFLRTSTCNSISNASIVQIALSSCFGKMNNIKHYTQPPKLDPIQD